MIEQTRGENSRRCRDGVGQMSYRVRKTYVGKARTGKVMERFRVHHCLYHLFSSLKPRRVFDGATILVKHTRQVSDIALRGDALALLN
jgi:hypothetical protein